jgi:hypothetical protein
MGCDSQFDDLYDTPASREASLRGENARLKAQLELAEERLAGKDPDSRGFDEKGEFFICRYDRTVTDSMDGHDKICTKPKK